MAIKSLKPRIQDLERFLKTLPPDSKSPTRAEKPVQKQRGETQAQIRDLNEELRLREELARAEQKPGNYLEVADTARKLNSHLQKTQRYQGSFQVTTSACFTCQGSFNHMQKGFGRYYKDVQGKKKRRKKRMQLIFASRAKAAQMPEGKEKAALLHASDEFARFIDAAEKAALSRDVYHYTDKNINEEGAPVGYLRGSDHPEMLERFGVSRAMLAPPKSDFRAEIYLPDPEIFGADAKPILVFKGTDSREDVAVDVAQARGNVTNFYTRARNIAKLIDESTGGKFEIAGHSLGACLATSAGIVTGAPTTAYNPAGLHPNTIAPYPMTEASNISAYVVDGEILNSSQDAANHAGTQLMLYSASLNTSILAPARLITLVAGAQLASIPTQVGVRTTLPSQIGDKTPNVVTRHKMDTVINSIEQEKKRLELKLK